jgi:hypothetical protein
LQTEWDALLFLRAHGVEAVPQPIARDEGEGLMLMEWIAGDPVEQHSDTDLDAAVAFVTRIFALSADPGASRFGLASEACLSLAEITRQIDARVGALRPIPAIEIFLANEFLPAFAAAKAEVSDELARPTVLPTNLRRLIPADFGFHNALRQRDGTLRFIDFDYFGWDDPVKLTADVLLHPAMCLSAPEKAFIRKRLQASLPDDEDFAHRLDGHLPLYALRWSLILLNRFRRDRRVTSDSETSAEHELVARQIAKASAMCGMAVQ